MCYQVTCGSCGKPTWNGCGNHIEQALAGVPAQERCTCHQESASAYATEESLTRFFGN